MNVVHLLIFQGIFEEQQTSAGQAADGFDGMFVRLEIAQKRHRGYLKVFGCVEKKCVKNQKALN